MLINSTIFPQLSLLSQSWSSVHSLERDLKGPRRCGKKKKKKKTLPPEQTWKKTVSKEKIPEYLEGLKCKMGPH